MKKIFARNLSFIMIIALVVIMFVNYQITQMRAREDMQKYASHINEFLGRIISKNNSSFDKTDYKISEVYLSSCKSFKYMVEQNPDLLKSKSKLKKLRNVLNVDELLAVDENGNIFTSTNEKSIGFNIKSSNQSSEFMQILDNSKDEYIQSIQKSPITNKMFQYIGVKRTDKSGILMIGLSPNRYSDIEEKNSISSIFSKMPVDEGNFYFAFNTQTNKIIAHTEKAFIGLDAYDCGVLPNYQNYINESISQKIFNKDSLVVITEWGNLAIGVGKTDEAVNATYATTNNYLFIYIIAIMIIITLVILLFLKQNVISGIHKFMNIFDKISNGNFDTNVYVGGNPEFNALSKSMEKMVDQLKSQVDRDNLTGLFCRRKFEEVVSAKLNEKSSKINAMIMFDIDNFKEINDTYGHRFGDQYLRRMARCQRLVTINDCYYGRRSGDEFYTFVYNLKTRSEIREFIEKFYRILDEQKITFPNGSVKSIKVSAGVYCSSNIDEDFDTMLHESDKRLYDAKNINKGSYMM